MFRNYYYSRCPHCNAKKDLFALNEDIPDILEEKYLLECDYCHKTGIYIPLKYYAVDDELMDCNYPITTFTKNYMKINVEFGVFASSRVLDMFKLRHKNYTLVCSSNLRF